jgi:hypothetical protein
MQDAAVTGGAELLQRGEWASARGAFTAELDAAESAEDTTGSRRPSGGSGSRTISRWSWMKSLNP